MSVFKNLDYEIKNERPEESETDEGFYGRDEPEKQTMKTYLGDGLYAQHDGYHFILTSENGVQVLQTVYLDQGVISAFQRFIDLINKQKEIK
jgi:hypothetical protein